MMDRIKKYFNGSMEPEPDQENQAPPTDLSTAARFFNLLGTIVIAASLVLFPVIGFHLTFIFFGILFIGISIMLKTQEQILQRLEPVADNQSQETNIEEKREEAI